MIEIKDLSLTFKNADEDHEALDRKSTRLNSSHT